MHLLLTVSTIGFFIKLGYGAKTETFMANENREGYGEKLMIQTLAKHFPDVNVGDRRALAEIVATEKGQSLLRNAAVKEMKKKIESQKRNTSDELLNDESYCNYFWLSWLPWLSCPETTKKITPLRYYQHRCNNN